ncbi:MAG: response regulator [Cyanobacteria bacterium P01_A01_bin.3]
MTHDTEQEVKLQFLEEAQDYLDAIETALLGLKEGDINGSLLSALRAAHSVKGGAAMMGFVTLSQAAHRYEDSLKSLKSQPDLYSPEVDNLLLSGLDGLRHISEHNRALAGDDEPPEWLDSRLTPVFDRLRELLGDPTPENDAVLLAESDGQDLATLMFETEVEARLTELETALDAPDTLNLRETFLIASQDLGCVGEMLELDAFCSLCQSAAEHIETVPPDRFDAVAREALQLWKRSRALVLAGQAQFLPAELIMDGVSSSEASSIREVNASNIELEAGDISRDDFNQVAALEMADAFALAGGDGAGDEDTEDLLALIAAAPIEDLSEAAAVSEMNEGAEQFALAAELRVASDLTASPDVRTGDVDDLDLLDSSALSDSAMLEEEDLGFESLLETLEEAATATSTAATNSPVTADFAAVHAADTTQEKTSQTKTGRYNQPEERVAEVPQLADAQLAAQSSIPSTQKSADRTVRVTIEKLERINDLFGEFAIERNALSLHLSRLQNLFFNLSERVKFLEQSRLNLRTAYDKASAAPALATIGGTSTMPSAFGQSGFDSLEMDSYSELHLVSQELMETIVQVEEIASDVELSLQEAHVANNDINRTSKLLQTNLTRLRMRPFQELVGRFPRAVRDLCRTYSKDVRLELLGGGTLLERAVLDVLKDPLMHLMRNAFDHGIEPGTVRQQAGKPEHGTISITAMPRSHSTVIVVKDDGGGIDLDKLRQRMASMGYSQTEIDNASRSQLLDLIFEPGFSTAEEVTELSGRGIGMDVVRSNLQQIRGSIVVDTELGQGTTFTLEIPIAQSSLRILMAESAGMLVAFPLDAIEEILLLESEAAVDSKDGHILNWDGYALPVISMNSLVQFNRPQPPVEMENEPIMASRAALVMVQGPDAFAIAIDRHWGEQEIVVRQVEGNLPLPTGFTGCTILGDGQVVPLADISVMFQVVRGDAIPKGVSAPSRSPALADTVTDGEVESDSVEPIPAASAASRKSVLVVDDSTNVRRFLALTLAKAGYQPEQAKDGQDALEKLRSGLDVQAVICDIEMPRMDGFGFLAHVRADAKLAQLPIAMLTSRSGSKHRSLAMELGATAYFTKPYQEFELLQKLEQMVNSQV